MRPYFKLGKFAVVTIILLRLCIGFHFFMEGLTKVESGGFSSSGFLGSAVGPLAPFFQSLLPDYDGTVRTDRQLLQTKVSTFKDLAAAYYGFDPEQKKQADVAYSSATARIDTAFGSYGQELLQYRSGFERIKELNADPVRERGSLGGQRTEIITKWRASVRPFMSEIDSTIALYEDALHTIAKVKTPSVSKLELQLVPTRGLSVKTVDKIIPIFDMSVGILLLLGLLTPVAGVAAGIFLVSVVLTQFPGAIGAQPTYYQAIEAVACFFLAAVDAGRYGGLDFIPWAYWQNRRKKKAIPTSGTTTGTAATQA